MIPVSARIHVAGVLLTVAALSGCAGGPVERITIDTEPQGADVYASGRHIGVTPLEIVLDDVFPMHWTRRQDDDDVGAAVYRRLGTLTLEKDGCEPYSMRVNTQSLQQNIKAQLKCDPNYKPPVADKAGGKEPAAAGEIERRLRLLDDLRKKKLVTEEEYREQRRRILQGI